MSQLKLNLFDNSHSFTKEALSKAILAEKDPTQWHFAILFLVQAIELILKERLRREHPILIYKEIDNPKKTTTLMQTVSRLQQIAKVEFKKEDLNAIEKASEWRNIIVHFEIDVSVQIFKPVFAILLGFLSDFHQNHFEQDLHYYIPNDLWEEAISINQYGNEIFNRAQLLMEQNNIDQKYVWICHACGWEAFVIQDDECTCYVCGHKEEVVECEYCKGTYYISDSDEIYIGNAKGLDASIRLCLSCIKHREEEIERRSWDH
ncbi:MAG: hypothetical protein ACHQQQ_03795 [Bacteroidota bacterium]